MYLLVGLALGLIYLPAVAYLVCKLGRIGYLQGNRRFKEMQLLPRSEKGEGDGNQV